MKILLTCDPEIPVPPSLYGGIERIVDALVNAYVDNGHNVTLCAHPKSNVRCRLVGWKGIRSQNRFDTLKNTLQLTSLVFKERFDIVHSFSRLAYMTAIMPFGVLKIMSYQREPSLRQVSKAVKLSKKRSLLFTGCSNYISNKLRTEAEAYTIYNCVAIDKYAFTEMVYEDAPLVFLGRIEDIKGTHIAIKVAQHTGKRLLIAGNIPSNKQQYFDEQVKPHLNERIQYIGLVDDEQKNELLGKALAFLMPIQWNEPFGIVMAEAMACGTPVLGFPYGAVPEVVQDGVTGFVCNDVDEMVQAVNRVNNIARGDVRKIAEEKFSNTKVSADYLQLYKTILTRSE